jgi:putative transposase
MASLLLLITGMVRRHRDFTDGITLHVTQRGNNRVPTFADSSDFEWFLFSLRHATPARGVRVHAYALMSNHIHLMVTAESETSLPRTMQSIGRRYVRCFNDRHGRTGTLWEGRHRIAKIFDERYWFACMRYIELNPVRAGLVDSPEQYEWSSYRAHALGAPDPVIDPHPVFDSLGTSPERRRERWKQICEAPLKRAQLEQMRKSIASGTIADQGILDTSGIG